MSTIKPPYRVPLMAEIREIPPNGFTVASFFAGAGGSSTGYRMEGFKVLYANEFVPVAQESYKANAAPYTVVDGRDVRKVTAAHVLKACGLKVGELDVMDGSPPCQAFSTAGRREKGWGKDRHYEHGASQKNEDLFFEFVRLRDGIRPKVFVAENVSGLVKGKAKGYFIEILAGLMVGYRTVAYLLDAQWLGVPQARQRIVFIGVRDDLGIDPPTIQPLPYNYSVREALPWLDRVVHDQGGSFQSGGDITDRPSVTILGGGDSGKNVGHFKVEEAGGGPRNHFKIVQESRGTRKNRQIDQDGPISTITAGTHGSGPHDYQIVGNSNATHSNKAMKRSLDDPAPTVLTRRSSFDLERGGPVEPETDISDRAVGAEYEKLNPGQQSEKYFSLVRADADQPAPTIMATGGEHRGIATVMHPTEKRKFTILEVKRLCSFPDDFVLVGSYGQQWERCGNSVPPVMMRHVAAAILNRVLIPARDAAKNDGPRRRSPGRSTNGSPPKGAGKKRSASAGRRRPT